VSEGYRAANATKQPKTPPQKQDYKTLHRDKGKPPTPQPPERREGERPGELWDEDNIASTPVKPRRATRKAIRLETRQGRAEPK
jgi:hypothetical protein